MKTCRKCGKSKSRATGFYAQPANADGLRHECKDCQNKGRRDRFARKKAGVAMVIGRPKATPPGWSGFRGGVPLADLLERNGTVKSASKIQRMLDDLSLDYAREAART